MTKQELFRRLIERDVLGALVATYGLNILDPTEKQLELVDSITNRLYTRFSGKLTVKDLQECAEENWIDNHELPNSLQKD